MTRTGLVSINCTQCGAAIESHGGGRVRLHVCQYCGAALDAQNDYKLLAQYRDMPRPKSPFALGQSGEILGVTFTVIGTIAWRETHQGYSWGWVDHQIYSPTHGYAWLTWENGWAVFTRKVRGAVNPTWVSAKRIENSESRPTVSFEGDRFTYFASGTKQPTFIEGEFNYMPTLERRPQYISLLGGDRMLHMQRTDSEIEYELSQLPPRETTLLAFGAAPSRWPKKTDVHPLLPYKLSSLATFTRNALIGGLAAALVLAMLLASLDSRLVRDNRTLEGAIEPVPFAVTAKRGLVEIELGSNLHNGWLVLEGEVLDASNNIVSAFTDGTEYYTGKDSDGRWSEGSRRLRVRTQLPVGQYTLALAVDENIGDKKWSGRPATKLDVTIRQGVASLAWVIGVGAAYLLGVGAFLLRRGVHASKRQATSDWND